MIIIIDTSNKTLQIDNEIYDYDSDIQIVQPKVPDFVGAMTPHIGMKEYKGIVADIQKWYYGYVQESAWCATCISYFANQLGVLDKIGGKNCNVNQMRLACQKAANEGKGIYYDRNNLPTAIPKNAILFYLFNGNQMLDNSNKHVSICYEDTSGNQIPSIGGNQSDSLCVKNYSRNNLYAVYCLS